MAKVNFIRKHTKAEVNDEPIIDGNFIVTGEGNVFIDYGEERVEIISSSGSITGDTLPIGSITAYGKETAPANWLICDGSAVSRTSYADLFAVIGTKYGEGDGSTTFNLPNLKGRVPVGLDSSDTDFNAIGKTGGEKNHTLNANEMPSDFPRPRLKDTSQTQEDFKSAINTEYTKSWGLGGINNAIQTGGGQPHNNLQPYEINNFIIKAFQSAGVVAEVVNTQTTSDTDTYSCNYINNQFNNLIKFKELSVTTTTDGTFQLLNINSNDLILFIAPIEIVNGYCIPYKYYGNNNWYGIAYSFTGQIVTNTTFKIKVFYMENVAN